MNNEDVVRALSWFHPPGMNEIQCKEKVLRILDQFIGFHKKIRCKAKVEDEGSPEKWIEISPKRYDLWKENPAGGAVFSFRIFGDVDGSASKLPFLYFVLKFDRTKWILQFMRNNNLIIESNLIMPQDIEKQNCSDMFECLTLAFLVFSRGVGRCEREYHDFKENEDRLLMAEGPFKKGRLPKKVETAVFRSGFQRAFDEFGKIVDEAAGKIGFDGDHISFNGERIVSLGVYGEVMSPLQLPMKKEILPPQIRKIQGTEDIFIKSIIISGGNNQKVLILEFKLNPTGFLEANWWHPFSQYHDPAQFSTATFGITITDIGYQPHFDEMKTAIDVAIRAMLVKFQEELVERQAKKPRS